MDRPNTFEETAGDSKPLFPGQNFIFGGTVQLDSMSKAAEVTEAMSRLKVGTNCPSCDVQKEPKVSADLPPNEDLIKSLCAEFENTGLDAEKGAEKNELRSKTLAEAVAEIPSNVSKLVSDNLDTQLDATSYFRKLLSISGRLPIEEVVSHPNVVPRLVEFLGYDHSQRLQFEAAWALTNIASGTTHHTHHVIECGALPILVRVLMSPCEEVRGQAVWALGNIAGDCPATRDMVLEAGALPPLQQLLAAESNATLSTTRNATWTLSNLCRGKPAPHSEVTKAVLPTLRSLISNACEEVMTDACWALSYLSDGHNECIQALVDANVTLRLVELLSDEKDAVVIPALRTVGNLVSGNDEQTQVVLNCNAMQALYSILSNSQHHNRRVVKEACWTVSNVTAGPQEQISAVINSGCIDPIVSLLKNGEMEIRLEAAWAITNATSGGDPMQIQQLAQCGCIPPLCELLRAVDPTSCVVYPTSRVVQVALKGLKNIMSAAEELRALPGGESENLHAMLEAAGALDLLKTLQNNDSSNDVSNTAVENLVNDDLSTFFESITLTEDPCPYDPDTKSFRWLTCETR